MREIKTRSSVRKNIKTKSAVLTAQQKAAFFRNRTKAALEDRGEEDSPNQDTQERVTELTEQVAEKPVQLVRQGNFWRKSSGRTPGPGGTDQGNRARTKHRFEKAGQKNREKSKAQKRIIGQRIKTKRAENAARSATRQGTKGGYSLLTAVKETVKSTRLVSELSTAAVAAGGTITVLAVMLVCLLGVVVCLFSGTGSNSTAELSISQEVYAYEPIIVEYATQYGVSEYVSLIEAVMMQESGGQGTDPMQASECGYNTLYPNSPNAITDPAYSIQVGIHELADCLNSAGVSSPSDLDRIRLALQGYNYGPGYITWAVNQYGGYTLENAAEFSELQKNKYGVSVYGDPEYVTHVLRYYSYNNLLVGDISSSQLMLSVAGNEVGYQEGEDGYTKYGAWYGLPRANWCAMFVSWCADQCGYIRAGICPKASYCPDIVTWFQERNQWLDGSATPPTGAYILFDWDLDGTPDHVGLVEYVQDGYIHTIEGNSSNQVKRNSYAVGSERILGYGVVG
jgi:hypothetical protein